jgi:beta-galactosidase/beta-glucuronidase
MTMINDACPRPEHPRPQMQREQWLSLNGSWDFLIDFSKSGKERAFYKDGPFQQRIIVPFCPESRLSGIAFTDFMAAVWYRRTVDLTAEQISGRVLLHFGAVDYHCEVWVNGTWCGTHDGGYASFSLDITRQVSCGSNTLVVMASDDNRSLSQPRGKQSARYHSHNCDYTRTTGIWQTVWLEFVPETYIRRYRVIPNIHEPSILFQVEVDGAVDGFVVQLTASYNGKKAGTRQAVLSRGQAEGELPLAECHLWEAGQPRLYDLAIELIHDQGIVDCVSGYFGLREIQLKDKAIYLNGRPVFQRLVLDQGFYPDGIYTAPSDADLRRDIELAMQLGFNGARLHQKVFEERFLYWADHLGYLVWGEHASWGLDFHAPGGGEGLKQFLGEWMEIVARDFNHPAIVGWCPFNETWDLDGRKQDDAVLRLVYQVTKAMDRTRPVIDTSGNYHVVTDVFDVHNYEQDPAVFAATFAPMAQGGDVYNSFPQRQTYQGEPYFVSEYGGTWWNPSGGAEGWGYGKQPASEADVLARYSGLTAVLLRNPAICAFCYTQLTDIEQEQNGLYHYDRSRKFSVETYQEIRRTNMTKAAIER